MTKNLRLLLYVKSLWRQLTIVLGCKLNTGIHEYNNYICNKEVLEMSLLFMFNLIRERRQNTCRFTY